MEIMLQNYIITVYVWETFGACGQIFATDQAAKNMLMSKCEQISIN